MLIHCFMLVSCHAANQSNVISEQLKPNNKRTLIGRHLVYRFREGLVGYVVYLILVKEDIYRCVKRHNIWNIETM